MATNNETVEDIVREIYEYVDRCMVDRGAINSWNRRLKDFASRIEAVWKREKETTRIVCQSAQAKFDETVSALKAEAALHKAAGESEV